MDGSVRISAAARPKIVLLEDDNGVRRSMQLLLQGRGFDVKAFANAASLLADPEFAATDCLLADYCLADTNGVDVLRVLRASGWGKPAVLITAFNSSDLARDAAMAGFDEVFEKPVKDHVLVGALKRLTASS